MDVNLVRFKSDGSQKSIPLPSSVTVIGRRHDCDLCIPIMSVSRRHCQLNVDEGVLKIRDLGSQNGTFLNGKRVDEGEIHAGDAIRIGPLTFVVQIDREPENVSVPMTEAEEGPKKKRAPVKDVGDEQFADLREPDESGSAAGELGELEELEELDSDSSTEMNDLELLD